MSPVNFIRVYSIDTAIVRLPVLVYRYSVYCGFIIYDKYTAARGIKKPRSTHTDPTKFSTTKLEADVEILIFIIKYQRIIRALFHEGWAAEN